MNRTRSFAAALATALVLAAPAQAGPATVYTNGDILTMAGDAPQYAQALVVRDGKIVFAGAKPEAAKKAGAGAVTVDLAGRTLLPGFQDTHGHLLLKMHNLDRLDVSTARNVDEVLALFRDYIAKRKPKPGEWAMGYLVPKPQTLGRLLTAEDLDKVSTTVPIFAQEQSGHIATLNTAGLRKLGFTAATPNPEGGTIRRRAGSQEPNGIIDEAVVMTAMSNMPPMPKERIAPLLTEVTALWAKHGYTTARELLAGLSSDDLAIARYAAQRKLLPIDLILNANAQLGEKEIGRHKDWQGRYYNRVKMGGVKIMMDGVPNSYTALMREPYTTIPDGHAHDFRGFPNVPQKDVLKYVDRYYASPLQINVHAMGDGAVENFLDAVQAAQKKHGRQDRRQMLHHAGLVVPQVATRIAATGTMVVFNSAGVSGFGRSIETYWGPERAKYTMPGRLLLDAGVKVAIGTDCPSGPTEPDVMRDIYGLVLRKSFSDDYVNAPEQRISMYEALVAVTRVGAYGNFEEKSKGTLEPGKLADLVILDRNPLKIEAQDVLNVKVLETIKEGRTIYRKR